MQSLIAAQFEGLRWAAKEPKRFFKAANENPSLYLPGAIAITILPWAFSFQLILASIISYLLVCFILYGLGKPLGGKARFASLLVCIGYANFPQVLIAGISSIVFLLTPESLRNAILSGSVNSITPSIPVFLGSMAFLISSVFLFIWFSVLYVLACKECHKLSPWVSILLVITSWVLALVLNSAIPL